MTEAKKTSLWVWISLVLIIGLFVSFIFFLDQKIVKTGRQSEPVSTKEPVQKIGKPKIDFYEVLKERNFEVPDDRTERVKNKTAEKKNAQEGGQKNQATADKLFLLQAGSFKKQEDAERMKVKLAFLGLEATIKKAGVNGVNYHRVELGPFADDGFFSKVKNQLIMNDIPYIQKSVN